MLKIIAVGRLTKPLELIKPLGDEKEVSNFILACRSNKETEFIQCTAWNEVARAIANNTGKGSTLYIEGNYKTKSYIDKDTQVRHERIFINVEKFEFLDKKPNQNEDGFQI